MDQDRVRSIAGEEQSLFGLSRGAVLLIIGIGFEAALTGIGVWITTWYRLNINLFDAAMSYLVPDFVCYLVLLVAFPLAINELAPTKFDYTVLFVFSWIAFIFVFIFLSSMPLF